MTVEPTFDDDEPYASVEHVNNCAMPSWYPQYRRIIPKARVLEAPSQFVAYLNQDGIRVPSDGYQWNNVNESSADLEERDEDGNEDPTDEFKEFHTKIVSTISELGGSVTPKLNWSAPKDSLWISTTNNLKCVTASDIYLLLKASSYISHDLTEAYDKCTNKTVDEPASVFLVLREWFDLNPALEFRSFVKNRSIVAITQRDMNYYDYLESIKPELQSKIVSFFQQHLQATFPDDSFVFDVYIPRPFNKVWLIDINPFAQKTDTLLFSWPQILNASPLSSPDLIDFRLVDKHDSSRGFSSREHTENHMPKEFIDASVSGSIVDLAAQLQGILKQQEQEEQNDD